MSRKKKKKRAPRKQGTRRPPAKAAPSADSAQNPEPAPEEARPPLSRKELATSLGLCIASAALWVLSCADWDIWPLAWVAMVPALFAIERAPTRKRAVLYGWVTGIAANAGGFYWVVSLLERFGHLPLPLAVLGLALLAAYQGVVFLLFAWVLLALRRVSHKRLGAALPMALLAPLVMVTFEMLVPFIFPWYLAITQAWVVPVIQVAELTGPVGVTALLLMVNGAVYDALTETSRRRRVLSAAGAGAVLAAALLFGFVRIGQVEGRRAEAKKIDVGVVQGNIPFDEKGIDRRELAARQLRDLQAESAELEAKGADLILWSESSYPYFVPRSLDRDFPEASGLRIRRGFTAPIVFGAVTADRQNRDEHPYNSALMLDREGRFTGRFDKIFLLIFGEYIPLAETFEFIEDIAPDSTGQFSRGKEIVTFPLEHGGERYRLGPMICYEDILPDFGRKLAAHHPHLLINLTNDAWFGDTSEPWQHLALSVYRAVEMRTDLVRSVNTGVSAFIDATGRVGAKSYAVDPKENPVGVDGLAGEVVLMEGGHTFYARFGDLFGWLCVALTLGAWLFWPRLPKRPTPKP